MARPRNLAKLYPQDPLAPCSPGRYIICPTIVVALGQRFRAPGHLHGIRSAMRDGQGHIQRAICQPYCFSPSQNKTPRPGALGLGPGRAAYLHTRSKDMCTTYYGLYRCTCPRGIHTSRVGSRCITLAVRSISAKKPPLSPTSCQIAVASISFPVRLHVHTNIYVPYCVQLPMVRLSALNRSTLTGSSLSPLSTPRPLNP